MLVTSDNNWCGYVYDRHFSIKFWTIVLTMKNQDYVKISESVTTKSFQRFWLVWFTNGSYNISVSSTYYNTLVYKVCKMPYFLLLQIGLTHPTSCNAYKYTNGFWYIFTSKIWFWPFPLSVGIVEYVKAKKPVLPYFRSCAPMQTIVAL